MVTTLRLGLGMMALLTLLSGSALAEPNERVSPPNPIPYVESPKLRRLQKTEVSSALLQEAARIVRRHHAKRAGTQIEVEVEGRVVVARIERHFHPEGGPVKPWGYHPGVSLFVYR